MKLSDVISLAEDLKAIVVSQEALLKEKGLSEEFRAWCNERSEQAKE